MERQAEVVKEWKKKSESGGDGGESDIQHGEDGERTLYSDAQWKRTREYER